MWTMRCDRLMVFFSLCLYLAAVSAAAESRLTINEFMAVNAKTVMDEDKEYSDWLEVYNAGPDAQNLQGWHLTDSADLLQEWTFPSTNLPPNGYMVIFASGKDRRIPGRNLHTSFGLQTEGEYLALVSPEGTIVDEYSPAYPKQFTDVSYGRSLGKNYYFAKATPGTANGTGYENYVADTQFSHDRGFYDQPFALQISTTTVGASIYWTTNGTLPSPTNGVLYAGPINIAGTTIVRAAAYKTGFQPSNVDTQSYLFLDDVIRQSPTGAPAPGWPTSWGSNTRDYGMDPDVVNSAAYKDTIKADLKTIPSFCLVMDLKDLFNSSTGIYANAGQDGRDWERKCSLELIYPDGTKGFQLNAGARIRGGYSRSTDNPKHAFRFFFRDEYGNPKLKYPIFGRDGAEEFDGLDLRCAQNYSWSFGGDSRGVFVRDQFSRDTQLAMGQAGERGNFYHLYINGQYWGLYNTCERPEASFAATYFGGDKSQYDVIKVDPGLGYTIFATDGNLSAWTRLYNLCKAGVTNDTVYQKLQGNNPDGTRNPAYERLLDPENLIDYMLVIVYGGNYDAPISWFLGNNSPNNWFGFRNTNGLEGFRFISHDAEHTMVNLDSSSAVNVDRTGPYAAGNSSVSSSSPQWVWQRLWTNAEFKLLVADRIQKHFFNGGALSPEAARERFLRRKNEIDRAVVGESARWGDSKRGAPLTRNVEWIAEINNILNNYLPTRTTVVLSQLKSKGLYPSVAAPSFAQHGGAFDAGFRLTMTAPAGTIYYTLDGSDPRRMGGAIAPGAVSYNTPVTLQESTVVRARAYNGSTWSALNQASFTLRQTFTNLLITEIMYHPLPAGDLDGDTFEFLEIKNANPFEIDLSGVYFTNGIDYVFPRGTRLGASQFLVLVSNPTNFSARYPGIPILGAYGGNLANSGERITLVHAAGSTLASVLYGDTPPWPISADGLGFSLVPGSPNLQPDPDSPANWRASSLSGGSPGKDDPALNIPQIVINEVLTHTDPPSLDSIELYNPGAAEVDIGNWYLSDDPTQPRKFRIPAGKRISAGGYLVFSEADFNPQPGVPPSFAISSHGDEVCLYSASASGELTGYADTAQFGAAANGVTFGRHTNSVGEVQFPAMRQPTLGQSNSGPLTGPVVISEIHYQPSPSQAEFVEIENLTSTAQPLFDTVVPTNTWKLNGTGFSFPTNVVLPAKGRALIVAGDPAVFRQTFSVPPSVLVLGPIQGNLQDGGELLELQRPDSPDLDTNGVVYIPYITVDAVRYHDRAPWPTNAAGGGSSLERLQLGAYGNDPANWRSSPGSPSPGLANDGNRWPKVLISSVPELQSTTYPARVTLSGSVTDDGLPGLPSVLAVKWVQISGSGRVVFSSPQSAVTDAFLPGMGNYVFRLIADDGELQGAADVVVAVNRPANQAVPVASGAIWKYWDKGPGIAASWKDSAFDDSSWPSGKSKLGYGEGNEATTIGFGPDSANKYVTTFFRSKFTVARAADVKAVTARLVRDDGAVIYLNGKEAYRNNMTLDQVLYETWSTSVIGGADESTWFEDVIDPALLRDGVNVLAVEVHQCNAGSSDLSFDFELVLQAMPANQPPTASAGSDQQVTLPAKAKLTGLVSDDGLPTPPGFLAASWTKVSGPGQVTFEDPATWETTAGFDAPGSYALRLSATDGVTTITDDLSVTVLEDPAATLVLQAALDESTTPPSLVLTFTPPKGRACDLQSQDSLGGTEWSQVKSYPAQENPSLVEFRDPIAGQQKYYRVILR